MINTLLKRMLFTGLLLVSLTTQAFLPITVNNLWIGAAPPSVKVLSAYADISNRSDDDIILQNISSPMFRRIEIHRTIIKDDVASMNKQSSLTIQRGSSLVLQPGDLHLMLFEPQRPLQIDDTVPFVFEFSNGQMIELQAIVKKLSTSHHHHH